MQQLSFPEIFLHILLTDFLRYFLAAGAAYLVFWIIFFKKWRHRVIQQKPLESDKIGFEFRYSMSTVFIFALVGFGIFSLKKAGYARIYDDFGEHSGLWFAVSIVLMILLHDAYFYWTHRLIHHPKIFRHVHVVHHRSTNPSPWAAYSFHPLEAVVEAGVFVLIVLTIPAHTLALFIFLIYMIIRNVLGHLGIEFLPAWFIRNKWLNWHTTTTHHDLHHKHFNGNYGLYFTWWDRCLGTEQAGYRQAFVEVTSRKSESDKDTEPFKISSTPSKHVAPMLLMLSFVSASSAQSAEGIWQTFHEESGLPLSLVKITEKNGSIEGKVIKIFLQPWEGEDPVCLRCPGEKKNAKIVGLTFMWGFKKENGLWANGYILDPGNGTTYSSSVWLEDANTLKVRGYWGIFYRTQTWKRVEKDGK